MLEEIGKDLLVQEKNGKLSKKVTFSLSPFLTTFKLQCKNNQFKVHDVENTLYLFRMCQFDDGKGKDLFCHCTIEITGSNGDLIRAASLWNKMNQHLFDLEETRGPR